MSSEKKPLIQEPNLWSGLKVSLLLHLALVAAFTVRAVFFEPQKIDYAAAVRVDIVALPDKLQEAPPPPKQEESAKTEPVKPQPEPKAPPKVVKVEKPVKLKQDSETINLKKEKDKQKEALRKLKAMTAIEEMKKEMERESKKAAGMNKTKDGDIKIKGNVLSPGTALTGLSKLQHDNYLATLDQQIKRHWYLPEWLAKKPLRAQVRLKIDEKGHLLSREIVLSSGNSSYDELALETIDKSAPYEAPPEKFVSIVAINGLLIGFPE